MQSFCMQVGNQRGTIPTVVFFFPVYLYLKTLKYSSYTKIILFALLIFCPGLLLVDRIPSFICCKKTLFFFLWLCLEISTFSIMAFSLAFSWHHLQWFSEEISFRVLFGIPLHWIWNTCSWALHLCILFISFATIVFTTAPTKTLVFFLFPHPSFNHSSQVKHTRPFQSRDF